MGDIEKLVQLKLFVYSLGEMKADWDINGAEIISQKAIRNALGALDILDENDLIPSKIIPITNGGIHFYIDRSNGRDVFEFLPDGTMGYIRQYIDYDREVRVNGIFKHFESLLDRFLLDRRQNDVF